MKKKLYYLCVNASWNPGTGGRVFDEGPQHLDRRGRQGAVDHVIQSHPAGTYQVWSASRPKEQYATILDTYQLVKRIYPE